MCLPLFRAVFAALLSVLLSACVPQTGSAPQNSGIVVPATPTLVLRQPSPTFMLPADAARLVDVIWMWQQTERPDGTVITARKPAQHTISFKSDGTLNAQFDCNGGFGTYTLNGTFLSINELGSTLIGCFNPTPLPPATPEPPQTGIFQSDFSSVERYAFENGNLVLHLRGNKGKMVFTKGTATTLSGQTWKALAYYVARDDALVSLVRNTEISATFETDGTLSGNAGCNMYQLKYQTSGDSITLSQPTVTRIACEPDLMQQEQAYLTALQSASKYKVDGNRLTLLNANNREVVVFEGK